MENLTDAVMKRLFIPLEASGRHIHLTKQQALTLFGHELTPKRPLSQPGQYLANERLTLIGPKGQFQNVAVLGPERREAQIEISLTDAHHLGLTPPIRPSGDTDDSPGAQLQGPSGTLTLEKGVICAQRHIHMTPADGAYWGVKDKQLVRLRTFTARPTVFEAVQVRISPDFATYAHLDLDEANACGFVNGELGRLEQ